MHNNIFDYNFIQRRNSFEPDNNFTTLEDLQYYSDKLFFQQTTSILSEDFLSCSETSEYDNQNDVKFDINQNYLPECTPIYLPKLLCSNFEFQKTNLPTVATNRYQKYKTKKEINDEELIIVEDAIDNCNNFINNESKRQKTNATQLYYSENEHFVRSLILKFLIKHNKFELKNIIYYKFIKL